MRRDDARPALWLDFDGGPWIGSVPLSRLSPWAELGAASVVGVTLSAAGLPSSAGIQALGWLATALLSPFVAVAGLFPLFNEGSWRWLATTEWRAAAGWAVACGIGADAVQAAVALPFGWRLPLAVVLGPLVAFGTVAALAQVPWDRIVQNIELLA